MHFSLLGFKSWVQILAWSTFVRLVVSKIKYHSNTGLCFRIGCLAVRICCEEEPLPFLQDNLLLKCVVSPKLWYMNNNKRVIVKAANKFVKIDWFKKKSFSVISSIWLILLNPFHLWTLFNSDPAGINQKRTCDDHPVFLFFFTVYLRLQPISDFF